MCKGTEHRRHRFLNNRVENAHQATRRKEKCLIKFKSSAGAQRTIALIGKVRNIFAIAVGRYTNSANVQRKQSVLAKEIWNEVALRLKLSGSIIFTS